MQGRNNQRALCRMELLPEHLKRIRTHTGTLKIRRRPGRDCRDPESMEGERRHVPVIWITE